jgi:hypothetical protein
MAPSKAIFAARLGAFLAAAVSLAHGRAELIRAGMEEPLANDPNGLDDVILDAIRAKPSFKSLRDQLATSWSTASLVYYICDGLSLNAYELLEMYDVLSVDGKQLRVAAIVSEDDRRGTMLRRDPRSGQFDDDSETHPTTFIAQRDRRLRAAEAELKQRGARLEVFESLLGTQEVLQRLEDTGFLN